MPSGPTAQKRRYNNRAYKQYTFRVRAGTALADRLDGLRQNRESLNYLITQLLCDHFAVPVPQLYRFDTVVTPLWPAPDNDNDQ